VASQSTGPRINERVKRNIESIAQLEQAFDRRRTAVDRISDAVSGFGGSIRFIAGNAVLIFIWLLWNVLAPAAMRFDPNLGALQLVIAAEALFLSAFVLMSQNRQNRQTDHWAHVELQISMLAEQETTKLLQMMQSVCRCLGMDKAARDKELKQLAEPTHVEKVAEEVGKARQAEEAGLMEVAAVLVQETLAEKKAEGAPAEEQKEPQP